MTIVAETFLEPSTLATAGMDTGHARAIVERLVGRLASYASPGGRLAYGATQARVFLEQLLPLVPNVEVQVAHLAGTGPGYSEPAADEVLAVLAEAVERHDPRTRRLWFDVASCVDLDISPVNAAQVAKRIHQVGVKRILYGSDAAAGNNLRPRESWAAFRRLPLTEAEFRQIAKNLAPYLR